MSLMRRNQQPLRIFQNSFTSDDNGSFKIDFHGWVKKTVIRSIICVSLIAILYTIKVIDNRFNYKVIDSIQLQVNKEFDLKESYYTALNWSKGMIGTSDKLLAVLNLNTDVGSEFILPMDGQIVLSFNEVDPDTNKTLNGILLKESDGQKVVATGDGVVIEASSSQALGHYLVVKHRGELISIYKHLQSTNVEINQRIVKGELIGISSDKLLFEMWYRKEAINPLEYIDVLKDDIKI
ncbi:murein hydrolase activator EnvC family protein [Alkaliphilus peptidifermentans]|uniref:Peptidase family M23 n=1 Tax=Alkaliphilus peptidifermentans DSM 18978 TaxID=1120976 RepID=A0A1G5DLP9_9FIRM|nr:M23 family metallopeptidase [Alkaliphilus peptidifermentans]SCY15566.1 Peptidase family M23 [Alkaliphilus peptidifermentans DSM 18978]